MERKETKRPWPWATQSAVKEYMKKWLGSQERVEILPVQNYVQPLKIDILTRTPLLQIPDSLFTLYEVKIDRYDLQRGPYQLETCRTKLEDRGLTECYIVIPQYLIYDLDNKGEYPFFISAMKRFGFGVITYPPNIITYPPSIYLKAKTFRKLKRPRWK